MGGDCSKADDTGVNDAPDMVQHINLTIGQRFTHPNYCNYGTAAENGKTNCGDNGEFQPGGWADEMCKCRGFCHNACHRQMCTRIKYSGEPYKCCTLGGKPYYEDDKFHTCNPDYRVGSWKNRLCDEHMKSFCMEENDNLFQPACKTWVKTFQNTGNTPEAGNGLVDQVITTVCERPENADRDECKCITGANDLKEMLPNSKNLPVQCFMNKCSNNPSAYRTVNQMQPCNAINCSIDIRDLNITTQYPELFNMNFVQCCGNSAPACNKDGTTPGPVASDYTLTIAGISSLVGVLIIIAGIFIIIGFNKYK